MYPVIADLIPGARNLFEYAQVKEGQHVVLITNPKSNAPSLEALQVVLGQLGASVTVVRTAALGRFDPLPAPAWAAMAAADCVVQVYPVFTAFCANLPSLREQMPPRREGGFSLVTADLVTPDLLASEWATFPLDLAFAIGSKIRGILMRGRRMHIVDAKGTDLRVRYDPGRRIRGATPTAFLAPGSRGHYPFGSLGMYPEEQGTDGTIYLDCLQSVPGIFSEPLKWVVKDGEVVEMTGGDGAATYLKRMIEGAPNARKFTEVIFGWHPKASIQRGIQDPMHWEITTRGGWFGLGDRRHMDGGILRPTVTIDDEVVVRDGELLFLDDAKIREEASKHGAPDELLASVV